MLSHMLISISFSFSQVNSGASIHIGNWVIWRGQMAQKLQRLLPWGSDRTTPPHPTPQTVPPSIRPWIWQSSGHSTEWMPPVDGSISQYKGWWGLLTRRTEENQLLDTPPKRREPFLREKEIWLPVWALSALHRVSKDLEILDQLSKKGP